MTSMKMSVNLNDPRSAASKLRFRSWWTPRTGGTVRGSSSCQTRQAYGPWQLGTCDTDLCQEFCRYWFLASLQFCRGATFWRSRIPRPGLPYRNWKSFSFRQRFALSKTCLSHLCNILGICNRIEFSSSQRVGLWNFELIHCFWFLSHSIQWV